MPCSVFRAPGPYVSSVKSSLYTSESYSELFFVIIKISVNKSLKFAYTVPMQLEAAHKTHTANGTHITIII